MSQGENAYLVLRGVFHVSPPALGGLSIDGKLTFSNNAYLKLTTEWIMLHGELTKGIAADTNQNPAARSPVAAENKSRYFRHARILRRAFMFPGVPDRRLQGRASELLQGA
jgi:hypothetical protein